MFKSAPHVWSRQRVIQLICAVVALLGLSAVIYVAVAGQPGPATSSGPKAAGTPTSAAPVAAPVGAAGTGTGVGAAAKTVNAPLTPKHPAQVAAWHAAHGGAALESLSVQLGNVLMTHGTRQFLDMKSACARLAAAVTTARTDPPIPDAAMQRSYQAALAKLAKAAADCQAAISLRPDGDESVATYENATILDEATSALVAGAKELYRATYKINTIKGR